MDVDGIKITSSFVTIPVGGRCNLSYRRDHGLFRKLHLHSMHFETSRLFICSIRDCIFGINIKIEINDSMLNKIIIFFNIMPHSFVATSFVRAIWNFLYHQTIVMVIIFFKMHLKFCIFPPHFGNPDSCGITNIAHCKYRHK